VFYDPKSSESKVPYFSSDRLLNISETLDQRAEFSLSQLRLDAEVGDHMTLPGQSGVWQISRLDAPGSAGGALRVVAKASGGAAGASFQPPVARGLPSAVPAIAWAAKPELIVLDIPNYTSESRAGVMAGGYVTPFNRMQISWLSLKWRRLNWTP
jgi:hypothetical protein